MEVKKIDEISKTQRIPTISSALQILNPSPHPPRLINNSPGMPGSLESIQLKPQKSSTITPSKPTKQNQEDE